MAAVEAPTISVSDFTPFKEVVVEQGVAFIPIGIGLLAVGYGFKLLWSYIFKGTKMVRH